MSRLTRVRGSHCAFVLQQTLIDSMASYVTVVLAYQASVVSMHLATMDDPSSALGRQTRGKAHACRCLRHLDDSRSQSPPPPDPPPITTSPTGRHGYAGSDLRASGGLALCPRLVQGRGRPRSAWRPRRGSDS